VKYIWLSCTLLVMVLIGCRSTMVDAIEEIRSEREEAVIQIAKKYFIAAGGKLEQYPDLFRQESKWSQRVEQARLVLYNLGQDETVPPSLVHRMTMYFAIMLSEASHGERQ